MDKGNFGVIFPTLNMKKIESQIILEIFCKLQSMVKLRKQLSIIRLEPELTDASPRNALFPAIVFKMHLPNQIFLITLARFLFAATSMICTMASGT